MMRREVTAYRADDGGQLRRRPASRARVASWIAGLLAIVALAGCTLPQPPGAGTVRYRDQVFSNVTVSHDLQYGSAPDANNQPVALKLDLYQPTGDTNTSRPAVIWAHGGGFCCGDKSSADIPALATYFAQRGYVAVSINYRLLVTSGCGGGGVTTACYNAALAAQHDGQAAVRWLRANAATYGIDPTRIAIGGESAGAIIATTVGVHADDPGTSGNPGYSSTVRAWVSISGGLPGGLFVDSTDAPGLLFSGTADTTVPFAWSVQTGAAMLNAGVPAVLEPLVGAGHVPWGQYSNLFETQSDYFLYDFLDLAHAQGQSKAAGRAFSREERAMAARYPRFARSVARASGRR
jgi:dienelactone hydrolase